jgi:uncharacterized membrane protein YqaE (UPF0057 family)
MSRESSQKPTSNTTANALRCGAPKRSASGATLAGLALNEPVGEALERTTPLVAPAGFHHMHFTTTETEMRLLLALILPWLQFFTIGRPFAGLICLILQLTLIGWVPAAIWSVYALSQYKTDEKIRDAMRAR